MKQNQAFAISQRFNIDLSADFHALTHDAVMRIVDAAKQHRYRLPSNANGSAARYFHACLVRAAFPKTSKLYVVQMRTEQGWEDVDASLNRMEARSNLRAYRMNAPGYEYRGIIRIERNQA